MAIVVTKDCRVTIPKAVRDLLGIAPGTLVEFRCDPDGRVVLRRTKGDDESRFQRMRGHAGPGLSTDEVMALTRGD